MQIPRATIRPHVRARHLVLYGAVREKPHAVILGQKKALVTAEAEPVIETDLSCLSSVPAYVPVYWATPGGLSETLPLEAVPEAPAPDAGHSAPTEREDEPEDESIGEPADPCPSAGYHDAVGPTGEQKALAFS